MTMTFRLPALAGLTALFTTLPAAALSPDEFAACQQTWQAQAREQGLPDRLIEEVIPALRPLARVLELDQRQPEFTSSFADYLSRRVSETRIETGQRMLESHADLLRRLTHEYGVPGRYLVSFWGLETNFGGYLGDMPTLDSLATLACDPRRSGYFTAELLTALGLLDDHGLAPQEMTGSWAGAMGHTQFMPSNYQRYGRDGDGDGRVDLWRSVPDALTSAAHFLSELGWESELRWGREVRLPEGFDYSLAGRESRRPLRQWAKLGIRTTNGAALPALDLPAALLVPAGHRGPAFLVYKNFDVIMRWNRSEFYAISVGRLADRIIGAGPLASPPPDAPRLSRATVKQLQASLNAQGFDAGQPDGILGPGTRAAISRFQLAHGMIADGFHSQELIDAVLAADASP